MASPSDFAPPEIEFNKLDDLPNKGKGKPHTAADIMKAMAVLHKMIHAQAKHYGGKESKLLPAGIAEGSLLKQVAAYEQEHLSEDLSDLDHELEAAYTCANTLVRHFAKLHDDEGMQILLKLIGHINSALAEVHKR